MSSCLLYPSVRVWLEVRVWLVERDDWEEGRHRGLTFIWTHAPECQAQWEGCLGGGHSFHQTWRQLHSLEGTLSWKGLGKGKPERAPGDSLDLAVRTKCPVHHWLALQQDGPAMGRMGGSWAELLPLPLMC